MTTYAHNHVLGVTENAGSENDGPEQRAVVISAGPYAHKDRSDFLM